MKLLAIYQSEPAIWNLKKNMIKREIMFKMGSGAYKAKNLLVGPW